MPPYDLKERTRLFALAVVQFCRSLPRTDEAQEAASQLREAANSTRANYRASRKGRSRAEFQAKLQIACEEADERDREHSDRISEDGTRQYRPFEEPPKELIALSTLL
jgi:four helix bundle protein